MSNIVMHLVSEKRKDKCLENRKTPSAKGIETNKVKQIPAEITLLTLSGLFSALYLVINLETVMGGPEEDAVNSSANTERAT